MLNKFSESTTQITKTNLHQIEGMGICQADYPLDWYQEELIPYAEEYQALPDRKLATILPWMEGYIRPAMKQLGDSLLLLAHYYMGGEIVKLIEHFGGMVGDSYQLGLMAARNPEKKIIVESAVHFMAETIGILADPSQTVYITNPKAGCTMEMLAKDYMVEPALQQLNERYGADQILPITYMNTSGRIKALTGVQGGAVCTSSNVRKIMEWALGQNKKVIFIPDMYMGENVAGWLDIPLDEIAYWPGGVQAANFSLLDQSQEELELFDRAKLILFSSYCAVHSIYKPEMVEYWQQNGYHVVVHPECRKSVVDAADSYGSTALIWDLVTNDRASTKKYAIGTENHMVDNVKQYCATKGIDVVNIADAPISGTNQLGCGCATMSRNDPPHLVGVLDLLSKGKKLDYNEVRPGDIVDEFSGVRRRLNGAGQSWLIANARIALENMISITESGIR